MFKNLIPWKKRNGIAIQRNNDLANGFHEGSNHPMVQFRREMDRMWNHFWDDWSESPMGFLGRSIDVNDNEDEYVVQLELPGFSPDDIDVSISGNSMTVRAAQKSATEETNGSAYHYGQFFESFTLPAGLDTKKIDAQFHHGLLQIHLPKTEASKARRITVKAE